ncbi:hypothetical protein [Rhizobium leguminosarum]
MDENWWPRLLDAFANEDPWGNPYVLVAQIQGFDDDPGISGVRYSTVALVDESDLESLGGKLRGFHHEVNSSGPRPYHDAHQAYEPWFRISAITDTGRIECEPLILSWNSNNRTAMVLDPGFAMTYGLIPRAVADGSLHWDNPAEPEFDIAVVSPPSVYEDLRETGARVSISRDYLQDYLTLRKKVLVEVFYITRRGAHDETIEQMLGSRDRLSEKQANREIDIMRESDGSHFVQCWGARILARPAGLPITENPLDGKGLEWPGLAGEVTARSVHKFRARDGLVYVKDEVLKAYEGREGFQVYPESGGVSFGGQWSVGHTARVGRDIIQVEVRKLYEGSPARVVQHWNSYAVECPDLERMQAVRNVGTRSKELVGKFARLGLRLTELAHMLELSDLTTENLIGLDPAKLDYSGWWNGPFIGPITRHIPVALTRDEFLHRCGALDKVLMEALSERYLRQMLKKIGKQTDTYNFKGLKLLDRTLCLAVVANQAGLSLLQSRDEIVERFSEDGCKPEFPLSKLFALSDLRQMASHRKEVDALLPGVLKRFGIDIGTTAKGWGAALDTVYDGLIEQLNFAEKQFQDALKLAADQAD